MSLYDELKQRLSQDFSADNLDATATLAFEFSWNIPDPLGLFVVERVLRILESQWDVPNLGDQAWMNQSAVLAMEAAIRPPLLDYLTAAGSGPLSPERELQLLNGIARALFRWNAERPEPR